MMKVHQLILYYKYFSKSFSSDSIYYEDISLNLSYDVNIANYRKYSIIYIFTDDIIDR